MNVWVTIELCEGEVLGAHVFSHEHLALDHKKKVEEETSGDSEVLIFDRVVVPQ